MRLLRNAERDPWSGQSTIPSRQKIQTTGITEPGRPTFLCVTYDVGYHNSGWWANADYNQCWHISVSHIGDGLEVVAGEIRRRVEAPEDREVTAWAEAFFGDGARLCAQSTALITPIVLIRIPV